MKQLLSNISRNLDKILKEVIKQVDGKISEYFEKGKKIEIKERSKRRRRKKQEQTKPIPLISFLESLFTSVQTVSDDNELDFNPELQTIEFEGKSEVENLIRTIDASISLVMKQSELFLRECITKILDEFETQFEMIKENDTTKIIRHLEERLGNADFQVSIRIPDSRDLKLKYRVDGALQDFFEEKTRSVIKRRRQSGIWGGICALFSTEEWGWESYESEETRYVVDFGSMKNNIKGGIRNYFSGLNKEIEKDIEMPIKEDIRAYFDELKLKIENLRGDFVQSIQDHGLEKKKKEELHDVLTSYGERIPEIQRDCIQLKKDLEEILIDDADS